jgi:hypothetical protein
MTAAAPLSHRLMYLPRIYSFSRCFGKAFDRRLRSSSEIRTLRAEGTRGLAMGFACYSVLDVIGRVMFGYYYRID